MRFFMRLKIAFKKAPRRLIYSVIFPFVILITSLQIITFTETQDIIDQNIFHPFIFRVREQFRPQTLDPRIKIFAFDDGTAEKLKNLDIPLPEWGLLFQQLSKKQNLHIVIDKLFENHYSDEDIRNFSLLMDRVTAKTSILTYTQPREIKYLTEINAEIIAKNQRKAFSKFPDQNLLNAKDNQTRVAYGAPDSVLSKFSVFGHNEYLGDNHTQIFQTLKNLTIVPNTALNTADSIVFKGKSIYANDRDLHADKNGRILLNFARKDIYLKNSYSFYAAIHHAKKNLDISVINPGDYVVILPAMYTGNTDFKQTPFGAMPGGYTLVAVIQSILSGNWLREVSDPGFIAFSFGILGLLLGMTTKPRHAISWLIIINILTVSTSIALFILSGIAWSFILPVATVTLGCLAGVIVNSSVASIEESRLARDLDVATLVHKSFFRGTKLSDTAGIRVRGEFIPATECGGDWWGTFHKHGYSYVMLGDAVGHGIPAAFVTTVAFSATRSVEMELEKSGPNGIMPSHIMQNVNQVLCTIGTEKACMTFQVFRVEDGSGECVFANAGNSMPILIPRDPADPRLSKNQKIKTLQARGNILGLDRNSEFQNHTMLLMPGDRILLYTDGLIENTAESTGEPIGKNWLKKELERQANTPGDELYDKLWESYKKTAGSLDPNDDVTIVLIAAA